MKSEEIKQLNDTFNSELQQQIEGKLPAGHVYKMGNPSDILKNAGLLQRLWHDMV